MGGPYLGLRQSRGSDAGLEGPARYTIGQRRLGRQARRLELDRLRLALAAPLSPPDVSSSGSSAGGTACFSVFSDRPRVLPTPSASPGVHVAVQDDQAYPASGLELRAASICDGEDDDDEYSAEKVYRDLSCVPLPYLFEVLNGLAVRYMTQSTRPHVYMRLAPGSVRSLRVASAGAGPDASETATDLVPMHLEFLMVRMPAVFQNLLGLALGDGAIIELQSSLFPPEALPRARLLRGLRFYIYTGQMLPGVADGPVKALLGEVILAGCGDGTDEGEDGETRSAARANGPMLDIGTQQGRGSDARGPERR